MLLPRLENHDAAVLATHRILECLDAPFSVGGVTLSIDGSIGVAVAPNDGADVDQLVKCADIAMYDAKRSGNGISVYSPELDTSSPDRLVIVSELRVAIEEDQLALEYQPKIDLATGRIDGVEALVRWDHPRRGRLTADEFIGLAEDTGLIRQLTAKVIQMGIAQCRGWLDEGVELQVAINLSARCVQDPATVYLAESALAHWEVPARLLKFEITETSLVGDTERALDVLNRLAALGITLSIDDYGTGYSSLAYLKELPIHELKIDRLFTKHLGEAGVDTNIVRSTVDLGHSLGLRVVAEGVETSTSANELIEFGCDTAQGFYFSHPLSAEALAEWMQSLPPPEETPLTTAG
jgi:predicted signal transduction protein with EAL and GGDEF domain